MNRDRMLELRVLTGTHAGASAVLPEGAQVLGSAIDCDLILSDEGVQGRHLRLAPEADGSVLLEWEDGEAAPLHIRPGEGAWVGPVKIAIEEAAAPWRSQVTLRGPTRATEPGESGSETTAPDEIPAPHQAGGIETPNDPGATGKTREARRLRASLITGIVGIASIAGLALLNRGAQNVPAAQPVRSTLIEAPAAPQRDALERTIRQVGMADRVRVELRTGAPAVVRAANLSDEEGEVLAIALSRLVPRPALEITSEQEFTAAVIEYASRLAREKAPGIAALPLGDARYAITGRVADDATRHAIQSEIRQAFPQARGFEWRLETPAEATASLIDDLRAAGFEEISGRWDGGAVQLAVPLDEPRLRAWETALARAARRHDLPMRATVTLRPAPPTRTGPPHPVMRTVVGGPLPYVVLADGRKLAQGGEADGWRLIEVQAGAVVFEAAGGRRISLER